MAVLRIITYPNKKLRERCIEVAPGFDCEELVRQFSDMEDTLDASPSGIALAANQVGLQRRMLVFKQDVPGLDIEPWVLNPTIVQRSEEIVKADEGCLSFPEFRKQTERSEWVIVRYDVFSSEKREKYQRKFDGLAAQVWQHEVEHLDGMTFVDDLSLAARERIAAQMTGARKGRK